MRDLARVGSLCLVVVGLTSACATRGWVREELGRHETEVGQRFGQVEGRMTESAQRVEGMGTRMTSLEGSLGATSELAQGARTRADEVDSRVTRLWANRYSYQVTDSIDVPFGFDRADLEDRAQTVLASVLKELQANPRLTVELLGYADSKGGLDYNYQLSHRRAEAVRRFLVEKGVQLSRVRMIGLGPVADPRTPAAQKRRVTVKLMVEPD